MHADHATPVAMPSDPPHMNWANAQLADLPRRSVIVPIGLVVAAVFVTMVDVHVLYPAIARSLRGDTVANWFTAVGIGLLALLAMGLAGWHWRGARGNHPGSRAALILPVGLVVGWVALGVLIVVMRATVAEVSTSVAYEGVSQAAGATRFDMISAGVFLAVFALCGLLVFGDAYHWRNDAYRGGVTAAASLSVKQAELDANEGRYQQLSENEAKRRWEIDGVRADAKNADERNAAFAAELKQVARFEIAVGLGDPAKTGITSPHHPDNPFAEDADRTKEARR